MRTLIIIAALLVTTHAHAQTCENCQAPLAAGQILQPPDGVLYVRGPLGGVWIISGEPLYPQFQLPAQPVRRMWSWLFYRTEILPEKR